MRTFGERCDAITNDGKRCRKKNGFLFPSSNSCINNQGPPGEKYVAFKPVRLCGCHASKEHRVRHRGERLKLHHGGWFGAYSRYKYGNLVIDRPVIDWNKVKRLVVPEYWAQKEG